MRWSGPAGRALVVVAAAGVGFLLVSQLRTQHSTSERLQVESEQDLTRIFAGLNEEADALRDEITELRIQLQLLGSSTQRDAIARQTATRELDDLEVLAGLAPAAGPGVVVRIDDPAGAVGFDRLLGIVQELRNARAEAVAVNGIRVGASSAFDGARGTVQLDGAPLSAPYTVLAIGDPSTLEGGLRIPGGAVDTLTALVRVGVTVERQGDVRVPALRRTPGFRLARPAGGRAGG